MIREIQGDDWEWGYAIFKKSEDQERITYRSSGR